MATSFSGGGWADDFEDSGAPPSAISKTVALPAPTVTGPDEKGIKTIVSYRMTPGGQRERVTQKFKLVVKKKRVSRHIQERRQWPKFGECSGIEPGTVSSETTFRSKDEVRIENPGEELKAARREEEEMIKRLRAGRASRQKREDLEAKEASILGAAGGGLASLAAASGGGGGLRTGTALSQLKAAEDAAGGSAGGGGLAALAGGAAGGGKYVPLHMRAGAESSRFEEEEQQTLRVTNISEDTDEDNLRELFAPFGRIQRVYLARDRETGYSRGFAYISYHAREDAKRAMDKLNGYGYDHLILKVEWAKPSAKDDSPGQSVMRSGIVSGYGGALPQGLGG